MAHGRRYNKKKTHTTWFFFFAGVLYEINTDKRGICILPFSSFFFPCLLLAVVVVWWCVFTTFPPPLRLPPPSVSDTPSLSSSFSPLLSNPSASFLFVLHLWVRRRRGSIASCAPSKIKRFFFLFFDLPSFCLFVCYFFLLPHLSFFLLTSFFYCFFSPPQTKPSLHFTSQSSS